MLFAVPRDFRDGHAWLDSVVSKRRACTEATASIAGGITALGGAWVFVLLDHSGQLQAVTGLASLVGVVLLVSSVALMAVTVLPARLVRRLRNHVGGHAGKSSESSNR
jgi:hypothetical protein